MSIELIRIDERLVHGQVAYSWSVAYPTDAIAVIDNGAASDPMQKMLLEMAVPSGKKAYLFTEEEAVTYFSKPQAEKVFIVVKGPKPILTLVKNGVSIPSVNLGGMYFKEGREEITKTVYVGQEDKELFQQLNELGVVCEIRTAPGDRSINLFDKI